MTVSEADVLASDVAWNIDTLLPEPGAVGIESLLAEAEQLATRLATCRGSVATMSSAELAEFMHGMAQLAEAIGRAGNYAHLAFAVDTEDPSNGARLMMVEERSTAINTQLLWFELEWAALSDVLARLPAAESNSGSLFRRMTAFSLPSSI